MRQPLAKLGAVRGIGDQFNAEADFGEGDDADEQQIERLGGNEGDNFEGSVWAAAVRKEYWYRAASPSQFHIAHGQPFAPGFDIYIAVG